MGDIAELKGGNSATRERIERLDVVHTPHVRNTDAVSKDRICLRLLLAGYSFGDFSVTGPDQVSIIPEVIPEKSSVKPAPIVTTVDGSMIEIAIRDALASRFEVPSEDLDVHLAGPLVPTPEISSNSSDDLRIEPYLPSDLRLGRTQMRVALYVGKKHQKTISASVDIARYQTIARASELIMPGDPFTDQNIKNDRQRLTGYAQYVSATDAIGRKARRKIKAGEAVRIYDVDDRRDNSPFLVKPRDRVHLVARNGRLVVTLTDAEVLKAGRLSEYILVKNPRSGKEVVGRVLSRSEVEVNF